MPQTPRQLIKDPLVLEFLGLEERTHYSERDLESAIIDSLESFLLELGKGFLFEARQESGLNPLAVNVAEKSHYPATREEAERIIRQALAAGQSFDVGVMQINSWWMKHFSIDPYSLLDPAVNEAWGKWILAAE